MGKQKIYIADQYGNKLTPVEASALIGGYSASNIRYHIANNGAKTVMDVLSIMARIKEEGKNFKNKCKIHKTIYGKLTLREMWERHPFKKDVSMAAINTRICSHDSMWPGVWADLKRCKPGTIRTKRKICEKCGMKLKIINFQFDELGKRNDRCDKCLGLTDKVEIGKPVKNVGAAVEEGSVVKGNGGLFYVAEVFDDDSDKYKPEVTGFRVMPNGQILRRTTVFLGREYSLRS